MSPIQAGPPTSPSGSTQPKQKLNAAFLNEAECVTEKTARSEAGDDAPTPNTSAAANGAEVGLKSVSASLPNWLPSSFLAPSPAFDSVSPTTPGGPARNFPLQYPIFTPLPSSIPAIPFSTPHTHPSASTYPQAPRAATTTDVPNAATNTNSQYIQNSYNLHFQQQAALAHQQQIYQQELQFERTQPVIGSKRGRKARRKRTTPGQFAELMKIFNADGNPSNEVRERLAQRVGMSNREVQVWFQNRRAKESQVERRNEDGSNRRWKKESRICTKFSPMRNLELESRLNELVTPTEVFEADTFDDACDEETNTLLGQGSSILDEVNTTDALALQKSIYSSSSLAPGLTLASIPSTSRTVSIVSAAPPLQVLTTTENANAEAHQTYLPPTQLPQGSSNNAFPESQCSKAANSSSSSASSFRQKAIIPQQTPQSSTTSLSFKQGIPFQNPNPQTSSSDPITPPDAMAPKRLFRSVQPAPYPPKSSPNSNMYNSTSATVSNSKQIQSLMRHMSMGLVTPDRRAVYFHPASVMPSGGISAGGGLQLMNMPMSTSLPGTIPTSLPVATSMTMPTAMPMPIPLSLERPSSGNFETDNSGKAEAMSLDIANAPSQPRDNSMASGNPIQMMLVPVFATPQGFMPVPPTNHHMPFATPQPPVCPATIGNSTVPSSSYSKNLNPSNCVIPESMTPSSMLSGQSTFSNTGFVSVYPMPVYQDAGPRRNSNNNNLSAIESKRKTSDSGKGVNPAEQNDCTLQVIENPPSASASLLPSLFTEPVSGYPSPDTGQQEGRILTPLTADTPINLPRKQSTATQRRRSSTGQMGRFVPIQPQPPSSRLPDSIEAQRQSRIEKRKITQEQEARDALVPFWKRDVRQTGGEEDIEVSGIGGAEELAGAVDIDQQRRHQWQLCQRVAARKQSRLLLDTPQTAVLPSASTPQTPSSSPIKRKRRATTAQSRPLPQSLQNTPSVTSNMMFSISEPPMVIDIRNFRGFEQEDDDERAEKSAAADVLASLATARI